LIFNAIHPEPAAAVFDSIVAPEGVLASLSLP